jgi:hypothetical protein
LTSGSSLVAPTTSSGGTVGPDSCPSFDDERFAYQAAVISLAVLLFVTLLWALVATFGHERVRKAWENRPGWVDRAIDWFCKQVIARIRERFEHPDPRQAAGDAAARRQTGSSSRMPDQSVRRKAKNPGDGQDGCNTSALIHLGSSSQLPSAEASGNGSSSDCTPATGDTTVLMGSGDSTGASLTDDDGDNQKLGEAAAFPAEPPRTSTPAPGSTKVDDDDDDDDDDGAEDDLDSIRVVGSDERDPVQPPARMNTSEHNKHLFSLGVFLLSVLRSGL